MKKITINRRMKELFDGDRVRYRKIIDFIKENFRDNEPYVFGGMIRDIALQGGSDSFCSDIDIVCANGVNLEKISPSCVGKNKFGGYRILVYGKYIIDIWDVENTWAFKSGIEKYDGIESLLRTTQTNFEAVLYDINRRSLICDEEYVSDLADKYLKIVNNKNPNIYSMAAKIICSIVKNEILLCDKSVAKFINGVIYEKGDYWLFDNFLTKNISKEKYFEVTKKMIDFEGDLFPIDLTDMFPEQKKLDVI